MNRLSALAGFSQSQQALSARERKVFDVIVEYWPVTALEIAEHFDEDLGSRELKKKASTKYSYYLHKLIDKRVVLSKKAGNALVVWPLHVERYRIIHEILGR